MFVPCDFSDIPRESSAHWNQQRFYVHSFYGPETKGRRTLETEALVTAFPIFSLIASCSGSGDSRTTVMTIYNTIKCIFTDIS
jgi:hypothetical protein